MNARTTLAALLVTAWAGTAAAWEPFWSEDPNVEEGNGRFASQNFAGALESYRSAELSQRPEVQFNIGLSAMAMAEQIAARAALAPPEEAPPETTPPVDPNADGGTATMPEPPPAPAVDDDEACRNGVRPACLRLARSAFGRATAAEGNPVLRASAFHNLGNVYLGMGDEVAPPAGATLDDVQDRSPEELREAIDLFDRAIEQYRSSLVSRPGDEDTAWNLSYALRRKKELESLEEQRREQEEQEQEEQQDQQDQEQQPPEEQEEQRGDQQDIDQQIENQRDQEELFQQMRQREELEGEAPRRYERVPPERDW